MNRQGVGGMYLTVENIKSLDDIISGLNTIEDEKEKEQFLYQHIEDTDFFLETLKKLNKKKIPAKAKKWKSKTCRRFKQMHIRKKKFTVSYVKKVMKKL